MSEKAKSTSEGVDYKKIALQHLDQLDQNPPPAPKKQLITVQHQRLPEVLLRDVVAKIRVRIAGWRNDQPIDVQEDVRLFQRLEDPFVHWRDDLEAASGRSDLEKDQFGLNVEQWKAIQNFHENGGHASRLPAKKIEFIIKHGLIAFLELEMREGLFVTVGSVSALSTTPFTDENEVDGIPRDPINNLHALFPNYDLRDASGIPRELMEIMIRKVSKTIFIVRSTILNVLSAKNPSVRHELGNEELPAYLEGKELRRLGLAARGKLEIFLMAKERGSEDLSFNIGTISHPRGRKLRLDMGNKPSQEHNKWVAPLSWRHRYCDSLLMDPDHLRRISMFWMAHGGSIDDGIQEFIGPNGLLSGKGYPIIPMIESAKHNGQLLDRAIADGTHAPWLEEHLGVS